MEKEPTPDEAVEEQPASRPAADPELDEDGEEEGDAPPPTEPHHSKDGGWTGPYVPHPGQSPYPLTVVGDQHDDDGKGYGRVPPGGYPLPPPGYPPWGYPMHPYYPGMPIPPQGFPYPPIPYMPYGFRSDPRLPPPTRKGKKAEIVQEEGENDDGPEKTPRAPKAYIACNYCRMRKIKCDGTKPECSTCSRYGQPHCNYDTVRRKRGPAKKKRGEMDFSVLLNPEPAKRKKPGPKPGTTGQFANKDGPATNGAGKQQAGTTAAINPTTALDNITSAQTLATTMASLLQPLQAAVGNGEPAKKKRKEPASANGVDAPVKQPPRKRQRKFAAEDVAPDPDKVAEAL